MTRLRVRLEDGQVFDVDADKAKKLYPGAEVVAAFEPEGDRLIPVPVPTSRTGRVPKARKPRKSDDKATEQAGADEAAIHPAAEA